MTARVFQNPFTRSVFLHFILVSILLVYALVAPKMNQNNEPITISLVEPGAKQDQKSIVQPTDGELSKNAKNNAYLSDKTRVVKEETSSNRIGNSSQSASGNSGQIRQKSKSFSLSDLGVKIITRPQDASEKNKNWAQNSLGEALKGGQYIQGLKQGETSALNTKEFIFYSYFERVRRQLDQTWQPLVRGQIEKLYKSGRHLASQRDFITRTLITINSRGEIVRVQLLQESGAIDLDSAAINALNKAGPYPNPPKGLLDENGNAQIRWDFILKT